MRMKTEEHLTIELCAATVNTMRRMVPNAKNHNTDPAYVKTLLDRIGESQTWISARSGISRRRLQYLLVGRREQNGFEKEVTVTYPEQWTLECLAAAGDVFRG